MRFNKAKHVSAFRVSIYTAAHLALGPPSALPRLIRCRRKARLSDFKQLFSLTYRNKSTMSGRGKGGKVSGRRRVLSLDVRRTSG